MKTHGAFLTPHLQSLMSSGVNEVVNDHHHGKWADKECAFLSQFPESRIAPGYQVSPDLSLTNLLAAPTA